MMKKLYLISSFLICSINASQKNINDQLLRQAKQINALGVKVNNRIKVLQAEMQNKVDKEAIVMSEQLLEIYKSKGVSEEAQKEAAQLLQAEMQKKMREKALEMNQEGLEMSKKSLEINEETRRIQAQTEGAQLLQADRQKKMREKAREMNQEAEMLTKMNKEAIEMSKKSLEINEETRRIQAQTAAVQQSLQAGMQTKMNKEAETQALRKPGYDLESILIILFVTGIVTMAAVLREKKKQLEKARVIREA